MIYIIDDIDIPRIYLNIYRTLKGHTGTITGLAFDARGFILASCSNDMSAKLWDMNTHNCIKTLKGHDHTISGAVLKTSHTKETLVIIIIFLEYVLIIRNTFCTFW